MADFYDALDRYRRSIAELGHDLFSTYEPGLDRVEVVTRLEAEGIEPIHAVVDWFTFINGQRALAPDQPQLIGLFDNLRLVSLDEAMTEREDRLDPDYHIKTGLTEEQFQEMKEDGILQPFLPSWVPISRGQQTVVIETDRTSGYSADLIVLWSDEIHAETKAAIATEWVAKLTATLVQDPVRRGRPGGASMIDGTFFELGSPTLGDEWASQLELVAENPFLTRCRAIRLTHAPVASLAGNGGLENQQVAEVERLLRQYGLADWEIEKVAREPEITHLHEIGIFGIS